MHHTLPLLAGRPAVRRHRSWFFSQPPSRGTRVGAWLCTAVAVGLTVFSPTPAQAVIIGSVANFQSAVTVTVGDKDYTYLTSSANWTGNERLEALVNVDPGIFSAQFLISQLSGYSSPITLELGYKLSINGNAGPGWNFRDVFLGAINSGAQVEVWKDVFDTSAGFTSNPGFNTGTWTLQSINGTPDSVVLPGGLTDLWVRDTIILSSGGQVSSVNNTFRQQVPEIDPNSFGTALATVVGSLSLLERRARRWLGASVAA